MVRLTSSTNCSKARPFARCSSARRSGVSHDRAGNRDRRRSGRGARSRDRPPRPQTGEPLRHARRTREDPRLRYRERRREHGACGGCGHEQGTDPGMIVGTVGYMSPEQARGHACRPSVGHLQPRCRAVQMLSGQRPFRRASAIETLHAILSEDPPDIPPGPGDSPPALERIVRHCLEKAADLRFQSARDVAFALEGVLTRPATHVVGPGTCRPSLLTDTNSVDRGNGRNHLWRSVSPQCLPGDRLLPSGSRASKFARQTAALFKESSAYRGDLAGRVDVGHGGDDHNWPATLPACSGFCRISARRRQRRRLEPVLVPRQPLAGVLCGREDEARWRWSGRRRAADNLRSGDSGRGS